ncbi:MFS transporter [Alicyclobacillus fastidiosus]|uniref:MFS transporter n=1 Tax=Alicyclobacillus fastidiosus TaxID=392011 RepID=A0ABY6ZEM1_9BACL|nr:MFS transporter [Alicyclobacillus fastidiosus]WAH41289.1 MFS transporter [Alicyclobacillus fastidiosus]
MNVGRSRWYRICLMLFIMYLVAFVDRSNIGMAAPVMVKSYGLTSASTGVLLSVFFWGYVITQVPGGWVAEKFSAKRVIIGALIVWGAMAILSGLMPTFNSLLTVRFIMGLAEGVIWPAFAVTFVNWFPDEERGRAITFSEMSLPISSLIMAPLAGWMIHTWNYHVMFILQGIPPLIMAVVFGWLGSDSPQKDRFISESERQFLAEHRSTGAKETGSLLDVFANYRIWVFCIIYFLWVTGLYSFGLWLPSLVKQLSSSGIEAIGLFSAIPFILAALAMFLNGRWSDKHGNNRTWFVAIPLLIGGIALVVEHFIGFNMTANMIVLIVAGIGIYAAFGPWWAWCMSFVPRNQAGPAMGLINLVGNFGGIVGPIVVGIAAHGKNLINGFYILGFAMLLGFLLVVFVAGRFKIPVEKRSGTSVDGEITTV